MVTITPAQLGYLLEGIDWRMLHHTWRPQGIVNNGAIASSQVHRLVSPSLPTSLDDSLPTDLAARMRSSSRSARH